MEIKNKSIRDFIKKYVVLDERNYRPDEVELRYLLEKEIIVRDIRQEGASIGEIFNFVIEETSSKTGIDLITTYTYELETYDSMNDKLVLIDFKVRN